jgi:hypothetical protein
MMLKKMFSYTSVFCLILITSCSPAPEINDDSTNETLKEKKRLELEAVIICDATLAMRSRALVEWDTQTDSWNELLAADSPAMATSRAVYLPASENIAIIEQEDSSIVFIDLALNTTKTIYIDPDAELAGPKQPDYSPNTHTIVFTRIVDNQFKLFMISDKSIPGEVPIELYSSISPIISPCFNRDGNEVYFGIYNAEKAQTEIFVLNTPLESTDSLGTVTGELQVLDVSQADGSLIALTFLNQTGFLHRYDGLEWDQLIPETTAMGEAFALDSSQPVLAIPLNHKDSISIKFIDFLKMQETEKTVSLDASSVRPLWLRVKE